MKISWKNGKLTVSRAVKKPKATAQTTSLMLTNVSVNSAYRKSQHKLEADLFNSFIDQQLGAPFVSGTSQQPPQFPFGPPTPNSFPNQLAFQKALGGPLPLMPRNPPEVSANQLSNTRKAMCDVLEVAASAYAKDPKIKAKTDGGMVQVGPLLMDWKTIDDAVADKEKFRSLLTNLYEALDAMEAKKPKLPRQVPAQRVTPGGGARWSPR